MSHRLAVVREVDQVIYWQVSGGTNIIHVVKSALNALGE